MSTKRILLLAIFSAVLIGTSLLTRVVASQPGAKMEQAVGSPPQNIEWMAQLSGSLNSSFIQGDYAYFGIGMYLTIVDISDPGRPVMIGQAQMPFVISKLFVIDQYAYFSVVDATNQLHMVDVSDPHQPIYLQVIPLPITAPDVIDDVQVLDNNQVAMHGRSDVYDNKLFLIDFTNSPTLAIVEVNLSGKPFFQAPFVQDELLYTVQYYSPNYYRLVILDIGSPSTPQQVGFADIFWLCDFRSCKLPYKLSVEDGLASLSTIGSVEISEIHLFDVSNSAKPVYLGEIIDDSPRTVHFTVKENYVYWGLFSPYSEGEAVFEVFDIANPVAPILVGQLALDELKNIQHVEVVNQTAYVIGDAKAGDVLVILAIDVTNPQQPQVIGKYTQVLSRVSISQLFDGYAFSLRDDSLTVYDVADLQAPFPVSYLPLESIIRAEVTRKYIYIMSEDANGKATIFRVIDISNPANPRVVGSTEISSLAGTVAGVSRNYAFVQIDWGKFEIFDVSNPSTPASQGVALYPFGLDSEWWTSSIVFSDTHLFFAATETDGSDIHLRVIDISDPLAPSQVGSLQWLFSGGTFDYFRLYTNDDTLYAVARNELRVIDVSQPDDPVETTVLSGEVSDIAFIDPYIVAALDSDLVIWQKEGNQLNQVGYYPTVDNSYYVYADGRDILTTAGNFTLSYAFTLPVTETIMPDGGVLQSTLDQVSYSIPVGTFTDTVTFTHKPIFENIPPTNRIPVSGAFEFTAVFSDSGQTAPLQNSITITVPYHPSRIGHLIEGTLAVYYWDGTAWQKADESAVDPETNSVTAMLPYQALWQLQGETHKNYLPLIPYRQK